MGSVFALRMVIIIASCLLDDYGAEMRLLHVVETVIN